MEGFGKLIKKLREEKNMSLEKLAEVSGIDINELVILEEDGYSPERDDLEKLSMALEMNSLELCAMWVESVAKNMNPALLKEQLSNLKDALNNLID